MSEDLVQEVIEPEVVETPKKQGWEKGKKRTLKNLCKKNPHTAAVAVLAGRVQGKSVLEIKAETGLTKQAINKIFHKFEPVFKSMSRVEDFRRAKSNIVDSALLDCLELMVDPSKKETATLRDASYAVRVLNDVSRLEAGLATAISQSTNVNLNFTKARPVYDEDSGT